MKHNHNHDNAPSTQLIPIRFEFTHPTATTVCIAGTFNQWKPEAKTLHPAGGGRWWKETVLAPGTYEYCFVVDGQWMPDPLAKETVANPFGGRNSVLKVASSPPHKPNQEKTETHENQTHSARNQQFPVAGRAGIAGTK